MFMDDDLIAEKWHNEGMNIYWLGTELTMFTSEVKRNRQRIDEFK